MKTNETKGHLLANFKEGSQPLHTKVGEQNKQLA